MNTAVTRDVFLSHRSTNKEFVRRLAGDIEAQLWHGRSLRTWVDEAEIPPGGSIPGHVNKGLETSRFIALVMTPAYFDSSSGWTDAEWHAALHHDPDNRQGRILPFLVEDCPYIPFLLRHLSSIDLRGKAYDHGLRRLLAVLREEPPPRPFPYRGQLVTPTGQIDRGQLVAERALPEATPDVVTELIQCNLLPVERLPNRLYLAPIRPELKRRGRGGGESLPSKPDLIAAARAAQLEAGWERPFTPAFRVQEDQILSFHDLSDPDGPLAGVVDEGASEDFGTRDFFIDEDDRRIVISLLNMAIARHANGAGLVIDNSKMHRFFFPPKNGGSNVITWRPVKNRARRTVAKPMMKDDKILFWRHLSAYLRIIYLADRMYLKIDPTWVLTEDGTAVKSGPDIGRTVIRWTGSERNLHILYHIKLWTAVLRRGPGPITIRAGDQVLEISTQPGTCQLPYGIANDRKDLLSVLDTEAQILGEEEDDLVEKAVASGALEEEAAEEETQENEEDDDGPWLIEDEAAVG